MKAVVFHAVGDIHLEDVPEPEIQEPGDAIVRITSSAICGTDLHLVRGTLPGVEPGTIMGHEGIGVVEEVGENVRNFRPGDRVVISPTIACGYCSYCRAGYYAQCDYTNPSGPGTALFGGPKEAGGFHGLQAEWARIPFAATTLVHLPDDVADDRAILLSDLFPTGYYGAELARVKPGETVAVFGCGPVGQFTIASAMLKDAGRVFAIDHVESRLGTAAAQGAEIIDFDRDDPVFVLRDLTGGIGPDRVIDAVGVEAECPAGGDGQARYGEELDEIAPDRAAGGRWQPGNAPTCALEWAVDSIAKAGTMAIIGLYPKSVRWFPIGQAMMKNLKINAGNCNHRRYIPKLIEIVRSGAVDPKSLLASTEEAISAIDAYEAFDQRQSDWLAVDLRA